MAVLHLRRLAGRPGSEVRADREAIVTRFVEVDPQVAVFLGVEATDTDEVAVEEII